MSHNYRPGDKVRTIPWASAREPRDEWVNATITACIVGHFLVKFPNGATAARSLDEVEPATSQAVPMRDAWATWGAHLPNGSAIVVVATEHNDQAAHLFARVVADGADGAVEWDYADVPRTWETDENDTAVRLLDTLAPGEYAPADVTICDCDTLRAEVERLARELAQVVRARGTDQDRYHEEGRRTAAAEQIVRVFIRLGADE